MKKILALILLCLGMIWVYTKYASRSGPLPPDIENLIQFSRSSTFKLRQLLKQYRTYGRQDVRTRILKLEPKLLPYLEEMEEQWYIPDSVMDIINSKYRISFSGKKIRSTQQMRRYLTQMVTSFLIYGRSDTYRAIIHTEQRLKPFLDAHPVHKFDPPRWVYPSGKIEYDQPDAYRAIVGKRAGTKYNR